MYFNYVGTKVHYKFSKKKNAEVLILLHGWEGCADNFNGILELKKHYKTLEIDFPPFGKSGEPKGWNVFSYANMLISLCEHLNIKKCHILGHSFGGRVAILVSVIQKELVEKIVLVDSAGMKPKRKMGYYLKVTNYKLKKLFGRDVSKYGSADYKKLSENMKKTFSSIVNTYLEEYAKMITQPTMIVFGRNDKETPVYMAKRLKKLIPNSQLHIIEDASHFCFIDKPKEFCKVVNKFLRDKK